MRTRISYRAAPGMKTGPSSGGPTRRPINQVARVRKSAGGRPPRKVSTPQAEDDDLLIEAPGDEDRSTALASGISSWLRECGICAGVKGR